MWSAGRRSITLTSTGTGELRIDALTAPEAPLALIGGRSLAVPLRLVPGASCLIKVGFSPSELPARRASSFQIARGSSDSPSVIRLRGAVAALAMVHIDNPWALIVRMLLLVGVAGRRTRAVDVASGTAERSLETSDCQTQASEAEGMPVRIKPIHVDPPHEDSENLR